MNGQQLKNSILQMAVQGKLVPQDPNDEPASVLLERIRKEKEKLIKEGKIKKEKNPSYIFRGADNLPYEKVGNNEPVCIADEVPFEIPDSWEWVRISSIAALVTKGTTPRGGKVAYSENGIGFLRAENVVGLDRMNLSKLNRIDETTHTGYLKRSILKANDVLITIAGTLGRTAIVKEEYLPLNANQAVAIIRPVNGHDIDLKYLVYALNAPAIHDKLTAQKKITAIPNLTLEIISDCLMPIPPLNEQQRIVNRFALCVPQISEYADKETALNTLNKKFPELLKKSILQEAIQGKLVPQDPTDEPASVLLKRIRTEKQRLIKEGKIKKDKHESIIFRRDNSYYEKRGSEEICIDDEIPFEPPATWEFIRLNDIGNYRKGPFGSSLTKSMFVPRGENAVKVYEQKNAIQKDHTLGSYYISRDYYESKMSSFTVLPGDIIVSCAGTIGETYIMPKNIELGIINQALMRIRIYEPIDIDFFLLYFDYVIKKQTKENSKGSAIKNIPPFDVFKRIILPLPPVEEQKRIVERVHRILDWCNKL